ncbi:hypothetical protein MFFC18_18510 [Mariniblastus fucicola]|uniref:Uncharacterized protein n=1 Tax=Mariniblastus fucicola TaxID=980251 RepID=A0A5B9PAM8_9BACT|nr:hypothetical protein MFFC18_18510 [Mariniblastus fucicola]
MVLKTFRYRCIGCQCLLACHLPFSPHRLILGGFLTTVLSGCFLFREYEFMPVIFGFTMIATMLVIHKLKTAHGVMGSR